MSLTNNQLATLKTAINSETDPIVTDALSVGSHNVIADFYNGDSTFVVWKTLLTEHEIVSNVSPEATTWDWVAYIATSTAEKMAWERIFNGTYSIDPSKDQTRSGIAAIFSGAGNAAQRTHLLAVAKRNATRAEALYATGTGTTATPGKLTFEGVITHNDVANALNLP